MVNILLLERNGSIKNIEVSDNLNKNEIKLSKYTKNTVKFIHKWKLKNILDNVNNELSLNLYAKASNKTDLEINKHDLPPPLNNLENVYYGNIVILGLDENDNIINFDKNHWTSLVKILNKEEDDEEEEEEEEEEDEEDEEDEDFIIKTSDESDESEEIEYDEIDESVIYDDNTDIKEYEQIIGKQTVTIFRLKKKIKEFESKLN